LEYKHFHQKKEECTEDKGDKWNLMMECRNHLDKERTMCFGKRKYILLDKEYINLNLKYLI
jgi:hypothetical protein